VAVKGLQNEKISSSIYDETDQNCGRKEVFSNGEKSQLL
jgi:hypothetical protein